MDTEDTGKTKCAYEHFEKIEWNVSGMYWLDLGEMECDSSASVMILHDTSGCENGALRHWTTGLPVGNFKTFEEKWFVLTWKAYAKEKKCI